VSNSGFVQVGLIMGFLEKIKGLNGFDTSDYREFHAGNSHIGYIRNDKADLALSFDNVLVEESNRSICVNRKFADFTSRSEAIKSILPEMEAGGAFAFPLKNEMYPVVTSHGAEPLFQIERNATIFFGVRIFGLHVNGYTYKNGRMHMWLGRRGPGLKGWPNHLDQMVAGGQPIGMTLQDNLLKEAQEEARLPVEIASRAKPVGTVSYQTDMRDGARRDTLFIYDLELPEDVVPQEDGREVAGFECLPVEEVMEIVRNTEDFKPNCNLVAIDFFVRHGFICADTEPDYARIVKNLRVI
jgi:8-oxo-dGTP pyrophosphatase MutT (NUDIX family)